MSGCLELHSMMCEVCRNPRQDTRKPGVHPFEWSDEGYLMSGCLDVWMSEIMKWWSPPTIKIFFQAAAKRKNKKRKRWKRFREMSFFRLANEKPTNLRSNGRDIVTKSDHVRCGDFWHQDVWIPTHFMIECVWYPRHHTTSIYVMREWVGRVQLKFPLPLW